MPTSNFRKSPTYCLQIYCGGPLTDALGDNLSASGVKLRSILGATEFGIPSHLMPTHKEDWKEWCWVELDANASLDWEKQMMGRRS